MNTPNEYQELTPETQALLNGQEGRSVDFKIKPEGVKPDDIVAFANARGGVILVGAEEGLTPAGKQYARVVGCAIEDSVRQTFISMAASCRPAIDILVRIENLAAGLPLFRIDIPEGPNKPYCTGSGTYKIRADGQNLPIDPAMMRSMILEEESHRFVLRFKQASEDLLGQIQQVHTDLTQRIAQVEAVAEKAMDAAKAAEQAAINAGLWNQQE